MRRLVEESGIPASKLSRSMGRNEHYVSQILSKGKDVQLSTAAAVCRGTEGTGKPAHLYLEIGRVFHQIV